MKRFKFVITGEIGPRYAEDISNVRLLLKSMMERPAYVMGISRFEIEVAEEREEGKRK